MANMRNDEMRRFDGDMPGKELTLEFKMTMGEATDYRITDQLGREVTLADARRLWESGSLSDWNGAFQRLARNDFDIEKTMKEVN